MSGRKHPFRLKKHQWLKHLREKTHIAYSFGIEYWSMKVVYNFGISPKPLWYWIWWLSALITWQALHKPLWVCQGDRGECSVTEGCHGHGMVTQEDRTVERGLDVDLLKHLLGEFLALKRRWELHPSCAVLVWLLFSKLWDDFLFPPKQWPSLPKQLLNPSRQDCSSEGAQPCPVCPFLVSCLSGQSPHLWCVWIRRVTLNHCLSNPTPPPRAPTCKGLGVLLICLKYLSHASSAFECQWPLLWFRFFSPLCIFIIHWAGHPIFADFATEIWV